MADNRKNRIEKTLIISGSILGIVLVILGFVPFVPIFGWSLGIIWNVLWGILDVYLCLRMLASIGIISVKKLATPRMPGISFLVGIILFTFTGNWGGMILIIAAIVQLFEQNNN
nr:hypothetical protein [Candidatus Sigynarchaeota archaeon]